MVFEETEQELALSVKHEERQPLLLVFHFEQIQEKRILWPF